MLQTAKRFSEPWKWFKQVMHFVRDVDGEKLVGAWNDGSKILEITKKELQDRLKAFNSHMGDIKKGRSVVTFTPEQTEVSFNGPVMEKYWFFRQTLK